MGFALWIDGDLAWAEGLHEYRPMGVAVIAATDRFRPRDFDRRRPGPPRAHHTYAGLFASVGDLNAWLRRRLTSRSPTPEPSGPTLSIARRRRHSQERGAVPPRRMV
jgi:hypothetical protein